MKQSTSILFSVCGGLLLFVVFSALLSIMIFALFPTVDFSIADPKLLDVFLPSYVLTPLATAFFGTPFLPKSSAPITNRTREVVKYLLVAAASFAWLFGLFYALSSSRPYYAILLLLATFALMIIVATIKANKEAE